MTDPIRAKIQELVPEVMELKFGCRGKDFLRGEFVVVGVEEYNNEYDTYYQFYDKVPHPEFYKSPFGAWGIIGSPLTLAVVLQAIENSGVDVELDIYGGALLFGSYEYPGRNGYYSKAYWKLSKDYDGQSEEMKALIGKLLGV